MAKFFLLIGSLAGLLSVALGAFGAHALKTKLEASQMVGVYQTGVQYQFYHALALMMLGILMHILPQTSLLKWSGNFFIAGIVLFSFSLYVLSLTGIKWYGAVTPIGGLALLAGWGCLSMAIIKTL